MDIFAPTPHTIGKRIDEVRRERNMSYETLGKKIGTSRTNVYDIMTRRSIDSELLKSISKALNYNFFKQLSDEINEAIAEKQREEARIESLGTGTGRYGNTLGFQTYNTFDMIPPKFPSIENVSGSYNKKYDNCTEEEIMKSYQKYMSLF